MISSTIVQSFIASQQLPQNYSQTINQWFQPLLQWIIAQQQQLQRPILIGLNGCQGSGKSTLTALLTELLVEHYQLNVANLSIDDYYLTRSKREQLAKDIHPLLLTRGVPGTHDIPLLKETLNTLLAGNYPLAIPRFIKANDDRASVDHWSEIHSAIDIVLLEGWCMGIAPENNKTLDQPVNSLEEKEDPHGIWRRYVNQQIIDHYLGLYQMVDRWLMLQAPSFTTVLRWRQEQEEKLRNKNRNDTVNRIMSPEEVEHFIQHYQRLTEHGLRTLPKEVHYRFQLDENRQIIAADQPIQVAL